MLEVKRISMKIIYYSKLIATPDDDGARRNYAQRKRNKKNIEIKETQ